MATLFTPLQAGDIRLPNRIVMAPLTRVRAGSSHIPTDMMVDYYSQRASSGLIKTEDGMRDAQAGAGSREDGRYNHDNEAGREGTGEEGTTKESRR